MNSIIKYYWKIRRIVENGKASIILINEELTKRMRIDKIQENRQKVNEIGLD